HRVAQLPAPVARFGGDGIVGGIVGGVGGPRVEREIHGAARFKREITASFTSTGAVVSSTFTSLRSSSASFASMMRARTVAAASSRLGVCAGAIVLTRTK